MIAGDIATIDRLEHLGWAYDKSMFDPSMLDLNLTPECRSRFAKIIAYLGVERNEPELLAKAQASNNKALLMCLGNGQSLLSVAACLGANECVEFILKNQDGIDIEYGGTNGMDDFTPLMSAMGGNHPNTARLLISYGAKINARTSVNDISPLGAAVECLALDDLKIALAENVLEDSDGYPHIMRKIGNATTFAEPSRFTGIREVIDLLLVAGAKYDDSDIEYMESRLESYKEWPTDMQKPGVAEGLADAINYLRILGRAANAPTN